MNEKCIMCGGELIEGRIAAMYGLCFYPEGEEKKLVNPKHSAIKAFCCKECGNIRIMAAEPDKLR